MEPEVIGRTGGRGGSPGGPPPRVAASGPTRATRAARAARAPDTAHRAPRIIDGRAEDRHPWAVVALVVPLLFCAIVGAGVYLMFHRTMGYFKPAPSGRSGAPLPALAMAPPAPRPAAAMSPAVPGTAPAAGDAGRA